MARRLSIAATTIAVILCAELLYAQVDQARVQQTNTAPAPGWDEYQDLTKRLEAVEAENRWLRSVVQTPDFGDSGIDQASYCSICGDDSCYCVQEDVSCGWVDQLSSVCRERLSWNKGAVRIVPFGYVAADMIASEKAYTLLGGPLFLLPSVPAGIPDSRFTVSGQQTTLGLNVTGPDVDEYQSSATVAFNFFGDRPVQNNPGVFFMLGYVELKSDEWRFWAGQDADKIGRQESNSPSWTSHKQSGNAGQIRPGFRAERFFTINDDLQSSIYVGLTQQVVLDFIANPQVAGTDNGWPNVEFRGEVAMGTACDGQRPLVLAVGGLIGETRAVDFVGRPVANVSTTWAVIPELRFQMGRIGFQGEAFFGEALGTYNAGIGQSLNLITNEPIYTVGGFGELFCEVTPAVTVAVGYGIDNPRDADLAPNQRSRNATYWTNAICRWNEQWETRFEVARIATEWIAPSVGSRAMQYLVSVRYYF